MEERYIYLCEDSFEGIMSGVWRAYEDRHGHKKMRSASVSRASIRNCSADIYRWRRILIMR